MSHYSVLVLFVGKPADIETAVADALEPFNENKTVPSYEVQLTENDIARMSEHYSIPKSNLKALSDKMWVWRHEAGAVRDGKLYSMSTYNPKSKWDWHTIGGRWSGDIPDNSCKVSDIPKGFRPFAVLAPVGGWHERGNMGWWGHVSNDKSDAEWTREVRDIIEEHKDCWAILVDCHI